MSRQGSGLTQETLDLIPAVGEGGGLRTATLAFHTADRARTAGEATFEILRSDPAFGAIIPPDAKLEKLAGDFVSTKGPVWSQAGYLLFS